MRNLQLPDDFKAEWIWSSTPRHRQESYVFLRKEFTLDETPGAAELWISARTLFHLYVNGRHVTYGPPAYPLPNQSYVTCLNVGFLLETGQNAIAILAHNTSVSRYAARRQPDGVLAQLNVDGKPLVWTNNSWSCSNAECFGENRPRRTATAGFTEKLDFHFYPLGWQEREFNTNRWHHADLHTPVKSPARELIPLETPETAIHAEPFTGLAALGACDLACASTFASFQGLLSERGPGVYCAESFVYSGADMADITFKLFSDTPYRLFCNGVCIKEQGVVALAAGSDLDAAARQGQGAPPDGKMVFRGGWNRLFVCQLQGWDSCGFTLLLPEVLPGQIQFFQGQNEEELPGWALTGPLRAPLANITGSLFLEDLGKLPFHPGLMSPVNEAANLMAYEFTPAPDIAPGELPEILTLKQGQYAVIDLGQTHFGCPAFEIVGADQDTLDLVCGETLDRGVILPCRDGGQHVDTLILTGAVQNWHACTPRGLRYLMLVVRKAKDTVRITRPTLLRRRFNLHNPGRFACSDSLFNRIWETSRRTLDATVQDQFLDCPSRDAAQYLPDAMIQAWATFHIFGLYSFSAKGLLEFAAAQIETGEIPALCPSDHYVNIPDYALLWPVWLQRHHLHAGDAALLQRLIPVLRKLLACFECLEDPDTELLIDLDKRLGAPCFLDHADLDRHGISTGLNAIYCRALLASAWLLEQAGAADEGAEVHLKASRVSANLRALTWDAENGWLADAWHDDQPSAAHSWQTTLLALYGGVVESEQYGRVFDLLFADNSPFGNLPAGPTANPYFNFFVLETALALGYRDWAAYLLRWYWGGMLDQGAVTWPEFFNPGVDDASQTPGSQCHGYGVSPACYLVSELLGIRPAKPGFATVYFQPHLDDLEWAEADIPTPHGVITVRWERSASEGLIIFINANFPLDVIPMLDPAVSAAATFKLGDEVNLVTPDTDENTAPDTE
ncbi:MAG: family 78 glycoside hydrolase catalytic domain [Lentisphaeria bacterium]